MSNISNRSNEANKLEPLVAAQGGCITGKELLGFLLNLQVNHPALLELSVDVEGWDWYGVFSVTVDERMGELCILLEHS